MPTTIIGNPTGVAAPSAQPGPDTVVDLTAPQDGVDGVNAVTVNQPLTALANEQAWEKAPTAAAPTSPGGLDSAYKTMIKVARTSIGQKRDGWDARGFLTMARKTYWQEDWTDKAFTTLSGAIAADTAWAKRWLATQSVGGGTPSPFIKALVGGYPISGPGGPVYVDGTVVLASGNITAGPAGIQVVEAAGGTLVTDDTDMVFQTEVIDAPGGSPGLGNVETSWGISPGISGATGFLASTSPGAVAIIWPAASAHRQLYICQPGGTPHALVDLGAASTTAVRWRIEMQGANTSADGNRRVIVYADGAVLANVAYDFTTPSSPICWSPFFRLLSAGDFFARFGVSDFAAVRWGGASGNLPYGG